MGRTHVMFVTRPPKLRSKFLVRRRSSSPARGARPPRCDGGAMKTGGAAFARARNDRIGVVRRVARARRARGAECGSWTRSGERGGGRKAGGERASSWIVFVSLARPY